MYGLNKKGFICESEYDVSDEPLLAALLTTGNGYMGVRGSFEEYASLRVQGAFVRGYIDEITEVCEPFADNEYMKKYYLNEEGLKTFEKQESCVNMPDFLLVRVQIGSKTFFPHEGKILKWERELDTRTAELRRKVLWDDGDGNKTELTFSRFASFERDNLYCQRVSVRPVNHSLPVRIISGVDTAVKTGGQIITRTDEARADGCDLFVSFHANNKFRFKAAYAVRNRFPAGELEQTYFENGRIGASVLCAPAAEYVLEKTTFVGTERDTEREVCEWVKEESLRYGCDYAERRAAHIKAYGEYFKPMDVQIEGDGEADGWLRFASYHTAISASRHDCVHGVAAKGLTGERYNQFVWWDCEIHQLPYFIFTAPETAKQLLLYRYRMLAQSKKNAEQLGYKGAKYAFCSSVTGEEKVWNYVRHPFMQAHINSDIPMGIINYYECTGDAAFMLEYGMEMLKECSLFWLSRVTETNGRYEILQVTGTDEHHPYVNNDAYTNYCVAFVLKRFIELCDEFNFDISGEERRELSDVASRLYMPKTASGLIPQFDGYFSLSRSLEEAGKGTLKQFQMKKSGLYHKSQVIKQPDVVLLYTLADVGLPRSSYAENWDYYEQMCETSSSLTFPVHAIASAHNRRMLSFYNYFMDALKIDVSDLHGVGWQGVHSGCLAGGYLAVIHGLFGMRANKSGLSFAPNPMPLFKKITAKIKYRNREIELRAIGNNIKLTLLKGDALAVTVESGGKANLITLKKSYEFIA